MYVKASLWSAIEGISLGFGGGGGYAVHYDMVVVIGRNYYDNMVVLTWPETLERPA